MFVFRMLLVGVFFMLHSMIFGMDECKDMKIRQNWHDVLMHPNKNYALLRLCSSQMTIPSGGSRIDAVKMVLMHMTNTTNVDSADDNAFTPLHLAAGNGYTGVVETLLSYGSSTLSRNNDKEIPLHLAIRYHRFNAAESLLSIRNRKEQMCARNKDGDTPFLVAIKSKVPNSHIMRMVQWRAVDLREKNNDGRDALDLAKLDRNEELVRFFQQWLQLSGVEQSEEWGGFAGYIIKSLRL